MRISFFGGAREVGRSFILLEIKDKKIALDAGVKLGEHEELPLIEKDELQDIDFFIISHAHLDHSGFLPHIIDYGLEKKIYLTKPTGELTMVLLSDYLNLSHPDINKKSLITTQKMFSFLDYFKEYNINGISIKLYPAGHILGSSMIETSNGNEKILYTGDFTIKNTALLDGAYSKDLRASTLITESTYGGKEDVFEQYKSIVNKFVNSIKDTILSGGKVLIPSFAVGRAQEVLFILENHMRSGILPKANIYIDGMIRKAMRIYRHEVIYCNDAIQKRILISDDDPFKSKYFHFIKGKGERLRVAKSKEPAIIVTTSGMLTGGPAFKYLEHIANNSNDKIILVGYQAEGTNGRKLKDGERKIVIDEKEIEIKNKVEYFHLSAHADRMQLLNFINSINGLKNIFVVHGEERKSIELADHFKNKFNVYVPKIKDNIEL